MQTTKQNWNLDQLKNALGEFRQVKGWAIHQEHVRRRERYFMMDGKSAVVDQDRDVQSQNIVLKVIVRGAKQGRQGEVTQKLFPALPLRKQLETAVDAAGQTDHQAWEFPAPLSSALPTLRTTDPRMAEDVNRSMEDLTARVYSSIASPGAESGKTRFNSSEVFLSVHDLELHLSNGLVHRSSQSRAYAETAWSVAGDEYLSMRWSVNLEDLDLEGLFRETRERVEKTRTVKKPLTGKYPVIVDADVLAKLMNRHVSQLTAGNEYHRLPFVKPGQELIPGASEGDKITLTLDPGLDFGADTTAVSDQGVAQKPLLLVDHNRVVATSSDKQYADYLGKPATTARGSVVLTPGTLSYEELTKQGPKVLEILQFSALFVDPNSGTFSSEVRLGRLFDNEKNTVTYIKGGSLSGSITENFAKVRFSKNRVKRSEFDSHAAHGEGYFGPDYALLNDVSVVG